MMHQCHWEALAVVVEGHRMKEVAVVEGVEGVEGRTMAVKTVMFDPTVLV